MFTSTRVRSGLAVACCGVLAASLNATAGAAADSARVAAVEQVRITEHHRIEMDTSIRPGMHRFEIDADRQFGSFQLLRPDAGYSKAAATRDSTAGFQGDNPKLMRFERKVQLYGGAPSAGGETAVFYVRLPAGKYWALDTAGRTRAGKVLTVRVSGEPIAGALPGDPAVRATGPADWARFPRVIDSAGFLKFANLSEDNHFVELDKLQPGQTVADFRRWINKLRDGEDPGPPPVDFDVSVGSGTTGPGLRMSMRYDLPPGRYILVCWWPDASMDGMPHSFMGMYRGIRLR